MTSPVVPARVIRRALAAVFGGLALAAPAQAADPVRGDFDARPAAAAQPSAGSERARDRLRGDLGRLGALSIDPRTGTVRSVGRLDGFLTGPSGRSGADVALGFVRDHASAFGLDADDLDGLRLVRRSTVGGIEHLGWQQRYRGVPVADAALDAAVTASGRLISITGPPAPDAAVRSIEPALGARAAYAAARRSGGASAPAAPVARGDGGAEQATRFADGGRASLTLYRSDSSYRLAWRVLAPVSSTGIYDVTVDARSGAILRRANRVDFADAKVFEYNPAHAAQVLSPFGSNWLAPGANTLEGPNAHAFSDVHDVVGFNSATRTFNLTPQAGSEVNPATPANLQAAPQTVASHANDNCAGTGSTFPTTTCTWDPLTANSWAANRAQSVTQLFYFVNLFHDHLRADPGIAFDAHGFRSTGQPLGNPNGPANPGASDPVLAQTLDGADGTGGVPDADHRNNSNFATLPDGFPGLMQMYLWEPQDFNDAGTPVMTPFGGYDGSNDASLAFHEYTHGMTNRLITDAAGFGALDSAQAGAMGEGWSDFYALDYLDELGLETDNAGAADVRFGDYLDTGSGAGVRVQAIDCVPGPTAPNCPNGATSGAGGFTYADFGKVANGAEVHSDGEIWAQTLWSLRSALIAAHGGSRATGIALARRYVTEALRLSPPEPSFLDMRNAILEASADPADDQTIWQVFAARGMGFFASTTGSDDVGPTEDYTDYTTVTDFGSLAGSVKDEDANPLAGATVGIAGYDNGLGPQLAAQTDAAGAFSIPQVPATTGSHRYVVRARKPGYSQAMAQNVQVATGSTATVVLQSTRDWTSAATGASVKSVTGPDNTAMGCGPGGLIDDSPGVVWGSARAAGGQRIVVDMGAPIDLQTVKIDPRAGCGDDASAALGSYEVLGATSPDGPFTLLAPPATLTTTAVHTAFSGLAPSVRFLQLHAIAPQGSAPGTSGADFIDVAELEAAKQPGSPVGATVETGAAGGVGPSAATLTGTVRPNGRDAWVVFEYGPTAAYGARTAAGALSAGAAPTAMGAAASGLQPQTTYHFRAVAEAGGRLYPGADRVFTTGAVPVQPVVPPPVKPQPPPALASLRTSKVTADGSGRFKVTVRFAANAPQGTATLRVLGRKRVVLAAAKVKVKRGATVTIRLKLSKRGAKALKRGQRLTASQELRLPGGTQYTRSTKLARRR